MKKYICDICGYEYDNEKGEPERNIPAGTLWDDIPEDWLCPVCDAPKSDFFCEDDQKV